MGWAGLSKFGTRKKCIFATATYRCVSKIASPEARKILGLAKSAFLRLQHRHEY